MRQLTAQYALFLSFYWNPEKINHCTIGDSVLILKKKDRSLDLSPLGEGHDACPP